jgi:hypothetical protein
MAPVSAIGGRSGSFGGRIEIRSQKKKKTMAEVKAEVVKIEPTIDDTDEPSAKRKKTETNAALSLAEERCVFLVHMCARDFP